MVAYQEEQYRTTIVCIDSYENSVLSGRAYNPCFPEGFSFSSTVEFLKKMGGMLNEMKPSRPSVGQRPSGAVLEMKPVNAPAESVKKGERGTFMLNIQFQQNASWQGTVTWMGKERKEIFRSVLELLLFIDSALCPEDARSKRSSPKAGAC